MAPPTAASIVANGVSGKAAPEPEPAAEETPAPGEDTPDEEGAKEDGEDKVQYSTCVAARRGEASVASSHLLCRLSR